MTLLPILESLLPIAAVMATGALLSSRGVVTAEQWVGFERVTYYVFFPALIATALARADLATLPVAAIMTVLGVPAFIVAGLALLGRPRGDAETMAVRGPAFTSVFQGAVRWNSFAAAAVAFALHGPQGLAVASLGFAILIPFANVTSLLVLSRWGAGQRPRGWLALGKQLAGNPFLWSIALGLVLAPYVSVLPSAVLTFGDMLGRAALAAGLLLVGAGFRLETLGNQGMPVVASGALKLLVMPGLTMAGCAITGLGGPVASVVMICAAVPTATASYILARHHGGDAPLMAAIITGQTAASALTLTLWLWASARWLQS